jgi:hypothetical protein
MALRLQQPGIQPLGQYDGYDAETLSVLGGEVGTLVGLLVGGGDHAAKDADGSDGYVGLPPANYRPAVTRTLVSGSRPLFLIDDGTLHYGTLFGAVVGGTVGQQVNGPNTFTGAILGPHTATASGKLTLWDKPGHYAVTLDAVDTTASTGLVPGNASLSVGDPLYATSQGLLTPDGASSFEASVVVARFIEFTTDQSLVTTPVQLVSALNSPSGNAAQQLQFTQAVIAFNPPIS